MIRSFTILRVQKPSLRFNDLLGGFTVLRKTAILTVTDHYSKRKKILGLASGDTRHKLPIFLSQYSQVDNIYFLQTQFVTVCTEHCQPGKLNWASMWAITKACWTLASYLFKGQADSMWPRDHHMNQDSLIREDIPRPSKLPPGSGQGLNLSWECAVWTA